MGYKENRHRPKEGVMGRGGFPQPKSTLPHTESVGTAIDKWRKCHLRPECSFESFASVFHGDGECLFVLLVGGVGGRGAEKIAERVGDSPFEIAFVPSSTPGHSKMAT